MNKGKDGKKRNMITTKESVGIDLGDSVSVSTTLSPDGDVKDVFDFPMNEEGYRAFAERVPKNARIGFEATGMAYPVYRRLRELGYEDITVAHPKELKWITRSKKKNDRVDSLKIAKLLMVGMLPESHLDRKGQIRRDLLVQRVRLGAEMSSIKVSVIGYLKREGVYGSLPPGSDSFSVLRRRAIRSLSFGDDRDLVIGMMMDRLEFFEKQCGPVEMRIRELGREDEYVKLLMTIPGIDYYLASLIVSYMGDPHRFPDFDHLASFLGIIPATRESGKIRRVGRMSKDGPSRARWALSIAVDTVMERNNVIHDYYIKAKGRTGSGRMAHVLTMKKLARMMYSMMLTKQGWKWEDEGLTRSKLSKLDSSRSDAAVVEEGGDAA
ncbi:MAG: IS110 family transposase [Nitrososphaerota archaeon]|nr:IS110 family transposase [Nitrososphaerota archaeon]